MSFHPIKMCNVQVRKRPALFSTPNWQEKTSEGQTIPAVEIWRDQRMTYETWEIGLWTYDYNPHEEVFGLLHYGYPTHFAYYLSSMHNLEEDKGNYFDAGTSCPELYVEPEEWRRVLQELDIVSRYHSLQSEKQEVT